MNRLKELRIQNGYRTQKDLAAVLHVNQTAISQWEREATRPGSPMLLRLSRLYGVSVDYMLGLTDQKERPTPETEGGLSVEQRELIKLFEAAPPALRSAALAVLKSAEEQGKAPGGAAAGE